MDDTEKTHQPANLGSDAHRLQTLLDVSASLDQSNDLDVLLDRILTEARSFSDADSGTIYLVDGQSLRFAYNSGSTRSRADDPHAHRFNYLNHTMAINDRSIAGYVALTGQPLVIADAYHISDSVPYSFNPTFDRESNYHTTSLLTVPLNAARGKTVGVLQLVNAMDRERNLAVPFREEDILYVLLFGKDAASAIERATLTRRIILRMIRMAELRDPKETGAHVNRVGAYSVEIYDRWATTHGVPAEEVRRNKDLLRLAAMMHDVGKIGIPDGILKKPGRLDDDERAIMQTHTVVGARLFSDADSELDRLSRVIALNHHEKWDGTGYPGTVEDVNLDPITFGPGKKGEEIPFFARIVGLADVYDALCSRRTYKEAWDEEKVLDTIRNDSGTHFDPQIVDAFFEVHPVLLAVRDKYKE